MPYEFPKNTLKTREVIDPDKLTDEFMPAVEQLSGKLNANNFDGSTTDILLNDHERDALISVGFTYVMGDADTRRVGRTASEGDPVKQHGGHGASRKIVGAGWQTVLSRDLGYIDRPVRVLISGIGQYQWFGWIDPSFGDGGTGVRPVFPGHFYQYGDASDLGEDGPGPTQLTTGLEDYPRDIYGCLIQWGIRINGTVIEDSITGCMDENQTAVAPIKFAEERLATDRKQFPGPSGESTPQRASLGPIAWPSRVGCVVDMAVGYTTVELVCRRLDDSRYYKRHGNRPEQNRVFLYNLSLNTFLMPTALGSIPSFSSVNVPAFGDQDVLSRSSIYTQRLQKIESTLNSVREGNLAAGAFRPEHISQTGAVVAHDSISLHAKSEFGYSGFIYRNRRPDMEYAEVRDGASVSNPNKPPLTWFFGRPKEQAWCMWAVREGGHDALNTIDALLTDHDSDITSFSSLPIGTQNVVHSRIVNTGSEEWREEGLGFCCLRGQEYRFAKGRDRKLLITADVQVLSLFGDQTDRVTPLRADQKGACTNAGCYGFFRIGFHKKGTPDTEWVLPVRSEVYVNQFGNFRRHPSSDEGFEDVRPMATQANVSLQIVLQRPWLEEEGGALAYNRGFVEGDEITDFSKDYIIDGIALFAAGGENFVDVGVNLGLSGANLSAILFDTGSR